MANIELQISEQTAARARRLAEERHQTLDELFADLVESVEAGERSSEPLIGMFADEPELIDEVVVAAMRSRERDPLRTVGG